MTVPVSALQEVAPGAIIELFELQLNTTQHGVDDLYRFHAGTSLNNNGSVYWNDNEYTPFPIEADGFEYSGNGQLPRPTIRVSNILSTITALLLTLPDGLEGAKITRIRTLARYIDNRNFPGGDNLTTQAGDLLVTQSGDPLFTQSGEGTNPYGTPDPTAEFPREIYYVDRKTVENRDVVEFELAAAFDLAGIRAPKRQCVANICQWEYKSTECGYTGGLPTCLKTVTDCKAHFGQTAELPFGSYPGIGTYFG
jgi:phage-related protein